MLEKWQKMLSDLKRKYVEPRLLVSVKGKHSQESEVDYLKDVIKRQDAEMERVKKQYLKDMELMKSLCFANDYNGRRDSFVKIEEVAEDRIAELTKWFAVKDKDEDIVKELVVAGN